MMDYRVLLKKYILHVGRSEGVTFIEYGRTRSDMGCDIFSCEESDELEKLDEEINNELDEITSPQRQA